MSDHKLVPGRHILFDASIDGLGANARLKWHLCNPEPEGPAASYVEQLFGQYVDADGPSSLSQMKKLNSVAAVQLLTPSKLAQGKRNLERALKMLRDLQVEDAGMLHNNLAVACALSGDTDGALENFFISTNELRYFYVNGFVHNGNITRAYRALSKADRAEVDNYEEVEEAWWQLRRSVEYVEAFAAVYSNLALCFPDKAEAYGADAVQITALVTEFRKWAAR